MTEENTHNEEKEGYQVYELGYHLLSTLTEDELTPALDAIRAEITNRNGEFISEGEPELIELAYEMVVNNGGKHTKYDKAYFGWIKFAIPTNTTEELRKEVLDMDKNVLRYILIKTVREDTQVPDLGDTESILEEVETKGTIHQKATLEEGDKEEATDAELAEVVDEIVETAEEATTDADDLTKIEGIGPVIAQTLADNGITTFAQLADAKDEDTQEMIKDVKGNHKADTWNEQAALARDGKWDELKKLQDELDGGVEK